MGKGILYAGVAILAIALVAGVLYITYIGSNGAGQLSSNGSTFNYNYSSANATAIAGSDNNFTFSAYRILSGSSNESGNMFFSPFSAFVAMSMVAEGASGKTASQIYKGLDLSDNIPQNHAGFASILSSLSGKNAGYSLSVADALWVEKTYPFRQSFIGLLNEYYNATAYPADFTGNPNAVGSAINAWVSNKTYGKIQNLLPAGSLTTTTKAVLVNAVYFHGMWKHKFNRADTTDQNFYVNPSQTVSVPMMYQQLNASYYDNGTIQVLELDYNDSNVTMLIVLPKSSFNVSGVEKGLSAAGIKSIEHSLGYVPVRVWLPRFNITESMGMNQLFESLGITDAFDYKLANFSKMANFSELTPAQRTLYISNVLQKAFVTVDENGTTAAAATAVGITGVAVSAPPALPVVFRADHPFLFFIIDKRSGAILFMGRIYNPAGSS